LLYQNEKNKNEISLESPANIVAKLNYLANSMQNLSSGIEEYLPQLQREFYSNRTQPILKLYEGKSQFLRIFHQILEESQAGEETLILGESQDFNDIVSFDYYYNFWNKPRFKKNVMARVLWKQPLSTQNAELITQDKKEYRQSRILPKNFKSTGAVWITPHKVITWVTKVPKAVILEEQGSVAFYRDIFETLWAGLG